MSDLKPPKDEVRELLLESKCSMFHPTSRLDLLADWPELREVPSFMGLKGRPKEMLFVWFLASKTSYARRLVDERKRIEFAIDAAYEGKLDKKSRDSYLNKNWSDDITVAIADMARFEPSVRAKNKIHAERLLRNVEFIARTDFQEGDAPVDWDEKQKALKAIREAAELIPVIQKLAEGGFGIVVKDDDYQEPPGAAWARAKTLQTEEV